MKIGKFNTNVTIALLLFLAVSVSLAFALFANTPEPEMAIATQYTYWAEHSADTLVGTMVASDPEIMLMSECRHFRDTWMSDEFQPGVTGWLVTCKPYPSDNTSMVNALD